MLFDEEAKEMISRYVSLDKTVMLAYRGSIAHNMYIPDTNPNSIDDVDIFAVYFKEPAYYLSLASGHEKGKDIKEGHLDLVAYEFKKFIYLLSQNNPNVMTSLWLNEEHYIHLNEVGQKLIEIRDVFLSKRLFYTFGGYARSQFKRMNHFKFNGYMGEKRKALVKRFGFDTKNAAHLIRLLRMAIEVLQTGKLEVYRSDSEDLLQIKRGVWTLEEVKNEAQKLEVLLQRAHLQSKLPEEPDKRVINAFVFDTLLKIVNNT